MTDKPHIILANRLTADDCISVNNYAEQIRISLGRHEKDFAISTCSPIGGNISSRYVRAFARRVFYPAQIYNLLKKQNTPSLLHVTDQFYAYLLSERFPGVATCHDIADYKYTDLSKTQLLRWKKRVENLKRARLIFAVSEATARDLQNVLGIRPERIIVNHESVDNAFCRLPANYSYSCTATRLIDLSKKHVLALHVGSNFRRKNIVTILKAVAQLRKKSVPVLLVKVGDSLLTGKCNLRSRSLGRSWDPQYALLAKELGIHDAIIDLGRISKKDLVEVYNVCDVLMFPSLCEGFGFPILEAQSTGLPCVAANTSSLPEVGGDGALYHDPANVEELVNCMLRVLNHPDEKNNLIEKGLTNTKRFSWDAHVDRLIDGYRKVLKL